MVFQAMTVRRFTGRDAFVLAPLARAVSPATGDPARVAENLATVPRAGNISSDTRAG